MFRTHFGNVPFMTVWPNGPKPCLIQPDSDDSAIASIHGSPKNQGDLDIVSEDRVKSDSGYKPYAPQAEDISSDAM